MADRNLHRISDDWINGNYAFYNVYQASDGAYLALGCVEEKFWSNFCKVIKREDLIPEMFADEPRQSEIIEEIAGVILNKSSSEWLNIFRDIDVCITKVNNLEEALNDPHVLQRQLWYMQEYPSEGTIPQMSFPVKFSTNQPGWQSPPPQLGEHTQEVLTGIGYSLQEIEFLTRNKVI